jgi:hypothetical protein
MKNILTSKQITDYETCQMLYFFNTTLLCKDLDAKNTSDR